MQSIIPSVIAGLAVVILAQLFGLNSVKIITIKAKHSTKKWKALIVFSWLLIGLTTVLSIYNLPFKQYNENIIYTALLGFAIGYFMEWWNK